jgi:hypothetical protein
MDADFNYWAVSDVSDAELQTFKQLFEGQVRIADGGSLRHKAAGPDKTARPSSAGVRASCFVDDWRLLRSRLAFCSKLHS